MQFLKRHPLLLFFMLAALALAYAVYHALQSSSGGGPPGRGGPPGMGGGGGQTPVEVAEVRWHTMADDVESIGTSRAWESVDITAKVSDTVSRIHFQDGDLVEAGDLLVEQTNTAEAARLAEARATVSDAERQYQRISSLAERDLVSGSELDAVATNLETAEARLEGIMANMEDRLIRAPFSGVLGFREVSEGSMVSPGTLITTLDDISTIRVDFTIPESRLAQLSRELSIRARSVVYPDLVFEGAVTNVGARVDPVTRAVRVRADIDNGDMRLRPGMLLNVGVSLDESEVLVVPEQSVVPSQGQQFVFLVDGEGVARRVEVEVGRRRPGLVEIRSGLEAGQRVVTLGVGQVRPDQPVRILSTGMRELPRPDAESSEGARAREQT